jgi:pimeloyl-ACP methyl ester carboxylesterase
MDPTVQYATTSDGVSIAYWYMGEGPVLVIPPNLVTSHLELEWQIVSRRAAYEGLARGLRVVRYDCRGMGMSQRDAIYFSMDAATRDLQLLSTGSTSSSSPSCVCPVPVICRLPTPRTTVSG